MKNVLLKPVFTDNGMFNTINKRKRYVFVSIAGEYEIYRKDGLPDNDYTQDENDKYYLYVRFEDWAISLRVTKRYMTEHIGFDTILKDRYNGDIMNRDKAFDEVKAKGKNKEFLAEEEEAISRIGSDPVNIAKWIHDYLEECCNNYNYAKQFSKFPDFIGAVLLDKLDEAIELKNAYNINRAKKMKEAERKAKEAEMKAKTEYEAKLKEKTSSIKAGNNIVVDAETIFELLNRYNIKVHGRTLGWLKEHLSSVTFENGIVVRVRTKILKGSNPSKKFFVYLNELAEAIKKETEAVA